MAELKYKKVQISATVNPYLRKRAFDFVEVDQMFSSISDFVSTAMAMLIEKIDHEQNVIQMEMAEAERQRLAKDREASALLLQLLKTHPALLEEIGKMNIKESSHPLPKIYSRNVEIE